MTRLRAVCLIVCAAAGAVLLSLGAHRTAYAQSIAVSGDEAMIGYRQIGVAIAAEDVREGMVIEVRTGRDTHTRIAVGDVADLARPPLDASFHPCRDGERPIARDAAGLPRVGPGRVRLACGLTGLQPATDYAITARVIGADGQTLARSDPVALRSDVADVRLSPPDTRPIVFVLIMVLVSLVALLCGLRWWDLRKGRNKGRNAQVYVAPAIIGLTLLTFYPISYGIWLAFTDAHQTHLGQASFVGLRNFVAIASSPGLLQVSLFTAFWVIGNVTFHVGLGLALALVLNRERLAGRTAYRTVLLLPWAVPAYISVLAWQGMLQPDGLLNAMLGADVNYLGETNAARISVTMVNIWLGVPFMMLSLAGALKAIPTDMYEAAEIDGVSTWHQFRHITLPNLKNALVPLSLLGFIWTFNSFNTIYLLTRGGPYLGFGQPGATDIMVTYIFDLAFEYGNYGLAAAWSVFVFLLLVAFSWVYIRKTKATEAVA